MLQRSRLWLFWLVVALTGLAPGLSVSTAWGLAPVQGKEEEEEAPKKKPPVKSEEEEAPKKPPVKAEDGKAKTPGTIELNVTLDLATGPFNLPAEAVKLKGQYPAAGALLEEFVRAVDILTTEDSRGQQVRQEVRPLSEKYDRNDPGPLKYERISDGARREMPRANIVNVEHYELRALKRVQAFVQEQSSKTGDRVPPYWVHRAAEMVLSEVKRFHDGAISRKQRQGARWDGLSKELERELFQHRLAQLDALKGTKEWGNAYAWCANLSNLYPGDRALEEAIERAFVAHAETLLNENQDFLQARLVIKKLNDTYKFRTTAATRRVESRLQDRARESFAAAEQKKQAGNRTEMLSLLEDAARAWPETPGLREFILKEQATYPVLRVGVRHLPQQISPTTAATDSEKMAMRLVFESLLTLRSGPAARDGYVYKLGDDLRRIPQGYEIVLPENLKWSDGTPVRAPDILRSCELVTKTKNPLYDIDTAGLVEARAPDDRRVELVFKRAVLDPFAYLTFPLVPVKRLPSDRSPRDMAFGKQPLGSGPFMLKSADEDEVVFVANPHYKRWHAPNGPLLHEVRFIRYRDFEVARKNLVDGRWHMLLDLTTAEMRQLTGSDQFSVSTPTAERKGDLIVANPRIWFLAPNQRSGKPLANENLRKAIGLAIDRDQVLTQIFGRDRGQPHAPLNGPFPVQSWAYSPDFRSNLAFDLDKSADALTKAKQELGGNVPPLTLKYPAEALGAKEACERIRTQLLPRGIVLKTEAVPQGVLARELARAEPDYDLVYWCQDFEDERLSIRPLFDSSGLGEDGRNYLGTTGGLERYFDSIQNHRDLTYNMKRYHEIHGAVMDRMLLIPLWQLDTHVAWSRKLKFQRLHPLWIFDHIELWTLQ